MEEEKTEQATPRSRERAREKGQIPRSRELTGTLVLLIGFLTIYLIMNLWGQLASGMFNDVLGNLSGWNATTNGLQAITAYVIRLLFSFLWPVFAATAAGAILFNLVQTRGVMSLEPIRPKINNINPMQGLRRMFSTRGFVELVKAVLKIFLVILVTYYYVRGNLNSIVKANTLAPEQYLPFFGNHALKLGLWIIGVLLVLSILDYIYQIYQHERDLMLTKTEAKEEYKQMEGDPLVKNRIRQRQRQVALSRMLREVPRADVVVTNPTRVAVAIRYEDDMPAPQVVAKGKGAIAERIISLAEEFDVHVHRDPPLARSLFAMVEVGDIIPYEFYVAIAEVLAFVYRSKKKYKDKRKRMASQPA